MKKVNFNWQDSKKQFIFLLLIILGFGVRLLPHPANFTPISAIALFAALYLPKKWAIILPLAIMFASDLFIGLYNFKIMLSVYSSFVLVGIIGLWVSKRKKFSTVLGGTLAGSIIFFLVTNAAVWAFGTLYQPNFSGLIESYIMAIPFFRNSLLGDLFYVGLLVGGVELVYLIKKKYILCEK